MPEKAGRGGHGLVERKKMLVKINKSQDRRQIRSDFDSLAQPRLRLELAFGALSFHLKEEEERREKEVG